jgi:hypothetical protein
MRNPQEKAGDARLAWLAILHVLGLSDDQSIEQFEEVHNCLTNEGTLVITAAQFIIIGSGWADENYAATAMWDARRDLPQLHKLYAAAGGASHR